MSAREAERILGLFEQILEEAPAEREGAVDRLAAGDGELRRVLREMLAVDGEDGELLDQPVLGEQPLADAPGRGPGEVTELSGGTPVEEETWIGPYRLLRAIGQGGMGTAYLALRQDGTYERRVVIKLVRRGLESPETLRRLRAERQILASLDHPNIARLYDGGATEGGLPYFVMEYIDGVPIDVHCDENRLPVEARLDLFRRTCGAVAFAHRNLVVHRDLKPSNILVDTDGEPKLLDFGIAKLLNPELGSLEMEPTQTWQRFLTPNYASPEQVRGRPVTTVSDVYSLGVVLYRLLTGRLPFHFPGRSPGEIEKILTEEDPERPSTAVLEPSGSGSGAAELARARGTTEKQLGLRLAGDLDAIVLKALRSSPRERYGSVEQLVADLERFQRGEAVEARQGSWSYRTGKFLRRNRVAVALASVAGVALFTILGLVLWSLGAVRAERDQVRLERDKARTVTHLLTRLFEEQDPYVSREALGELTVLETLDRGLPTLERELKDQPLLRAELVEAAGSLYFHRGQYDKASHLLEEGAALRTESLGEGHPDVAQSRSKLSAVRLLEGELEQAEELSREALRSLEADPRVDPKDLFIPMHRLVRVLCYRGDYADALPLAERTLAMSREQGVDDLELANALVNLGMIKLNLGRYAEAVPAYQESIGLRTLLLGEGHPAIASPWINLGLALRRLERPTEAREAYFKALEIQEKALGEGHPDTFPTLFNLARLSASEERHGEALKLFNRALGILEASGAGEGSRAFQVALRRDEVHIQAGDHALAETLLRKHLRLWRPRLREGHWLFVLGQSLLGEALAGQGRDAEAEPLLTASFEAILSHNRYRHKREILDRLVAFLEARGRGEEAARQASLLVPVDGT